MPAVEPPEPTGFGEIPWLEPYPDSLLDDLDVSPEARYTQSEAIALAFVTALQALPPRQIAVLVLRDVLGFRASEVAEMLDTSVESANSALKRARTTMQRVHRDPGPAAAAEQPVVSRFVRAYESGDVDALVALFTKDIFVSMPPIPLEYQGIDVVGRLFAGIFGSGRRVDLVPTRANGQPAFGAYLRAGSGIRHGGGLFVLTLDDDRICAFTRFDSSVLPWFGLPLSLPSH
jgi:RNA polymerase sigma-70 factor (ECF subfamily)